MSKKTPSIKVLSESELAKKYSGSGIASKSIVDTKSLLVIPFRQLALNYCLGGGLPYGKIMELFGEESSGKTLLAMDLAYSTQQLGGIVIWNDAEQCFTQDWADLNGLDLSKIDIWNSTAIEEVSDWLIDKALYWRSKLVNNEPILFLQDSLAALDCLDNINSNQIDSKAEMGNRAKAIYKMLRIRNESLAELGVSCIFINQLRKKVGASMFEDPDTTPAGNAMKFYASQRLGVYGSKFIERPINDIPDRVGRNVSIRFKKNKFAPPRPSFKTQVFFNALYEAEDIGFSKYHGLPEILLRIGVLEKADGKNWYRFNGKSIANGEEKLIKKLKDDEELRRVLIDAAGINTISKTKKKLASISKNRFPISSVIKAAAKKQTETKDDE